MVHSSAFFLGSLFKEYKEEVLGWVSVLPFSGTITKSQAKKMETPFRTTNCENCCNAAASICISNVLQTK